MKNVHQIYISDNGHHPGEYVSSQMRKVKELYHDYNYTLYDNEMCRAEVKSAFGEKAAKIYDSLNSYSFKADLARYCILYKYAGFYFDATLCPEFKLEFNDCPVMYKAPHGAAGNIVPDLIDNGVMYFNQTKHPFLMDAIHHSLKNIKSRNYGEHTLDITGPCMLGRLHHYDICFGRARWINDGQKGAYFDETLHWLYKPEGTTFNTFEGSGTNSYERMWADRNVFR